MVARRIKCVVVGDGCEGMKAELLFRCTKGEVSSVYVPSVFENYTADFTFENEEYEIALWDTSHQEDYDRLRPISYPDTDVILVCFSVVDSDSFDHVEAKWIPEITYFCPKVPFVLVGAKIDLRNDPEALEELLKRQEKPITQVEAMEVAIKIGAAKYIECSAHTGEGIDGVLETAVWAVKYAQRNRGLRKEMEKKKKEEMRRKKKQVEQNKKLLRQNLNIAKKEHGTVFVRFLKLVCTGSGAAGKTSFVQLLLKQKFNTKHHSTNVVHTNHAVSIKTAAFHGTPSHNDKVRWIEVDNCLEIGYLRSLLIPTPLSNRQARLGVPGSKKSSPLKIAKQTPMPTPMPAQHKGSIIKGLVGVFKPSNSIKDSNLATFDSILASESSDFTYQPGEVLNMITLLDTGGQPEYIHLLPTINICPTVSFVVHDLTKSLDDQVLVEYSQHGEHVFVPYHLDYTNMDMIKLLMSAANGAVERPPSDISYLVATPGCDNTSYICLIGTHADRVSNEVALTTGKRLKTLVSSTKCNATVWHKEDGSVLFSVDNTTAGSDDVEDPIANLLRSRIEAVSAERDIYSVPITWMLFHLEIQQVCSENEKHYIKFTDCVTLAKDTGLISDQSEVRSVLLYYHLLRVLIYFEEVPGLCDFVIVDHQWWFNKLSSIITSTFQQTQLKFQAVQKLKYEGILSKQLLRCIKWEDEIKEDFFLSLLVRMKIIAAMKKDDKNEEQYFIPFVLPTYSADQESKILSQYGHLQAEPLMIQFQSGFLPRGLFCSLIVELLQHSPEDWQPHFSHDGMHHTFSNLITFSLPSAYSLSLFDKVSYLEVHVRHPEKAFQISVHNQIYFELEQALIHACSHLSFDHSTLQYGFLCDCNKTTEGHVAIASLISKPLLYAKCSISTIHQMKLSSSHLIWFLKEPAMLSNNGELSPPNEMLKDGLPTQPVVEGQLQQELSYLELESKDRKAPEDVIIKRPAMKLLHDVVVPRIAAHWNKVADYLEYEIEYKQVILKKGHHDPMDCCVILLEDWLTSNRGVSPKSWSKLIEVLKGIKFLRGTTEKIVNDLIVAGVLEETSD